MSHKLSVLIVLYCVGYVGSQSFSGVRPFGYNAYLQELNNRKQLSPQQQGHILSDIQQHQNRYQQHHQNLLKVQSRHKDADIVRNLPPNNFHQSSFQPPFSNLDHINNQNLVENNAVRLNFQRNTEFQERPFPTESFANNFGRQLPIAPEPTPNQLPFSRLEQQPSFNSFNSQPIVNSPLPLINRNVFNGNLPQGLPTVNSANFNQLPAQLPTVQTHSRPITPVLPTEIPRPITTLDPQKQKELELKQQIIEKHNQFVEKQYEKSLKKAQNEHLEWVNKQREHKNTIIQTLATIDNPKLYNYTQHRSRYVNPKELPAFERALELYFEEHPTTTTTTTTEAPSTTVSPRNIFEKFKQQLILVNKQQKVSDLPIKITGIKSTTAATNDFLSESTKSFAAELSSKHKFLPTVIPETNSFPFEIIKPKQKLQHRNDLSKQPKILITENSDLETSKNFTSREISLSNFENLTITDPKQLASLLGTAPLSSLQQIDNKTLNELQLSILQSTTTVRPPKVVLDELTKGVLPPGTDFEVIKHTNGGLEELSGIPSGLSGQKKVTFVLLEEQHDGSFKVQGIKGNTEDQNSKESVNVDSILQKIKAGEIKLPPSRVGTTEVKTTTKSADIVTQSTSTDPFKNYVHIRTEGNVNRRPDVTTQQPRSTNINYSTLNTFSPTKNTYSPTTYFPSTTERHRFASVTPSPTIFPSTYVTTTRPRITTLPPQVSYSVTQSSSYATHNVSADIKEVSSLIDVLKKNELYAMAKFLKQSGLDTILNETGPYSIFVPTDKAFRLMLIQLGGPQKAEEKFKENPRLLSGLLLHHIIPGSFEINQLQDEMTGVSLAGTQLRVNQYTLQDVEWNEIKVTTINGAKVIPEKQDIKISQGIVHAIDRVMFPLPVGDIVQTLQSDRDKKFTTFLKIFFNSDLAETLQDTKTFTLFAPIDKALSKLDNAELTKLTTDKRAAKKFVMKHIASGTMYTSGLSYYQILDSLLPEQQITVNKESDRIKVNNVSVVTQNIPATNGVIHVINGVL